MAERLQVYKCAVCGNIVEVLHGGRGQLVCCNEPMALMEEGVTDAAREKHVPVVERSADGIRVVVGSVAHPMEEKHFIEWIELIAGGAVHRRFLAPGEKPEAVFPAVSGPVTAREYCNLHGLWKG